MTVLFNLTAIEFVELKGFLLTDTGESLDNATLMVINVLSG